MRGWQEQKAFEAAELKRLRDEWVHEAADLKMGVRDAAKHLGMRADRLQDHFTALGIKTERRRTYVVRPTKEQRAREAMLKQLRDRAARKVAAGYRPEYARLEAAREIQSEMAARDHTNEAQA
tara:strand:- start:413 stop:781 length:369 start_codon:yes stop_codon:yes gene_type:complete